MTVSLALYLAFSPVVYVMIGLGIGWAKCENVRLRQEIAEGRS